MTNPDAEGAVYPNTVAGRTMDFTLRREPHRIVIDDDVFEIPQILAVYNLRRVVRVIGGIGGVGDLLAGTADPERIEDTLKGLGEIFLALMPGAAGEKFVARLLSEGRAADPENGRALPDPAPIDLMGQAVPALMFLLECYGLRPTVPSSSSAAGSTDGSIPSAGTSSADGASPAESASSDSAPTSS